MASAQCPRCELINWETDVNCRRCGATLHSSDNEASFRPERPGTLPLKKIVLFIAVAGVASMLAFKHWFGSPDPLAPTTVTSTAPLAINKKPLNTPGEEIDVRQYLAADKHTIVYFYADW